MPTSSPVLSEWYEQRRLAGRNFQCELCSQRWNEADLVWQDGLYVCRLNCYEENGGTIDRDIERARAAKLAAILTVRESRPPQQAGWDDDQNISLISSVTPRPLILNRGGASGTLTLTGVNFTATDTITYDTPAITNSVVLITDTLISLTVAASSLCAVGDHTLLYNATPMRSCISVR